ncbi:hypothetical protein OESDEN_08280 [Oesophagostomum dentatum]|uniref:Calponin-homology (CH) domain-containing protein n=1 Tax=Oesophagostomum dentatum TaxID=61180 RepID=A0A0B1T7Q4_OESDE|nr:hypothetical protein OESDEN_08280 [Oesophagostomum dentatum]
MSIWPLFCYEFSTSDWSVTGEDFSTDGNVENFCSVFKDGTLLCRLANSLQPGAVKKVNTSAMAFKQMENIAFFLSFAEKHVAKSELFQTVDLYEAQDPNTVLNSFSRRIAKDSLSLL